MAQQPLNQYKTITGTVGAASSEVYRTRTGYTSIVLYAQVANVGSGIGTVSLYHQRENRTQSGITTDQTAIIFEGLVPPNDALIVLDGRLVLERTALKTDSIRIVGVSTSTDLKYTISLLETLNQ